MSEFAFLDTCFLSSQVHSFSLLAGRPCAPFPPRVFWNQRTACAATLQAWRRDGSRRGFEGMRPSHHRTGLCGGVRNYHDASRIHPQGVWCLLPLFVPHCLFFPRTRLYERPPCWHAQRALASQERALRSTVIPHRVLVSCLNVPFPRCQTFSTGTSSLFLQGSPDAVVSEVIVSRNRCRCCFFCVSLLLVSVLLASACVSERHRAEGDRSEGQGRVAVKPVPDQDRH